jgi:hypothetical protein
MALTVVESPPMEPEVLEPPPDVALTPCDPWPQPYYLEDGLRRVCIAYEVYMTICNWIQVAPYHFTYQTARSKSFALSVAD